MSWIAAGSIIALATVAVAALQTVGQMLRAHARERNLMLNQLLHLAGRTWEPPPAEPELELEQYAPRFESSPPGLPDFYGGDE